MTSLAGLRQDHPGPAAAVPVLGDVLPDHRLRRAAALGRRGAPRSTAASCCAASSPPARCPGAPRSRSSTCVAMGLVGLSSCAAGSTRCCSPEPAPVSTGLGPAASSVVAWAAWGSGSSPAVPSVRDRPGSGRSSPGGSSRSSEIDEPLPSVAVDARTPHPTDRAPKQPADQAWLELAEGDVRGRRARHVRHRPGHRARRRQPVRRGSRASPASDGPDLHVWVTDQPSGGGLGLLRRRSLREARRAQGHARQPELRDPRRRRPRGPDLGRHLVRPVQRRVRHRAGRSSSQSLSAQIAVSIQRSNLRPTSRSTPTGSKPNARCSASLAVVGQRDHRHHDVHAVGAAAWPSSSSYSGAAEAAGRRRRRPGRPTSRGCARTPAAAGRTRRTRSRRPRPSPLGDQQVVARLGARQPGPASTRSGGGSVSNVRSRSADLVVVDRRDRGQVRARSRRRITMRHLSRWQDPTVPGSAPPVRMWPWHHAEPIEPDTKDWTWVLERPCPECGFDAGGGRPRRPGRGDPRQRRRLAAGARDRRARPSGPRPTCGRRRSTPATSATCTASSRERLGQMLTEDDARLRQLGPGRDRGRGALRPAGPRRGRRRSWSRPRRRSRRRTTRCPDDAWDRRGVRSNGSVFTVETLGRYHLHDVVHHL